MFSRICIAIVAIISFFSVTASQVKVSMYSLHNPPKYLGYVVAKDSHYGLLLIPHIKGLSPGMHGFHLHEHPNCDGGGKYVGGHLDPQKTNKHLGPYDDRGHLGDLPLLYVNHQGLARVPALAPRLSVEQLIGHSFIILADGDSYKNTPVNQDGSGPKIACGVIRSDDIVYQ